MFWNNEQNKNKSEENIIKNIPIYVIYTRNPGTFSIIFGFFLLRKNLVTTDANNLI